MSVSRSTSFYIVFRQRVDLTIPLVSSIVLSNLRKGWDCHIRLYNEVYFSKVGVRYFKSPTLIVIESEKNFQTIIGPLYYF